MSKAYGQYSISSIDDGVGISFIEEQYYVSTSNTEQIGGNWGTSYTFSAGKYIWTRSYVVYDDGTSDYTTPTLASGFNVALDKATEAENKVDEVTTTEDGNTVVDGTKIKIGSIEANKIASHTITADQLTTDNIVGTNGTINLANGTFNYGNGKLVWDGSDLTAEGDITATTLAAKDNIVLYNTDNKEIEALRMIVGTDTILNRQYETKKLRLSSLKTSEVNYNNAPFCLQICNSDAHTTDGVFRTGYIELGMLNSDNGCTGMKVYDTNVIFDIPITIGMHSGENASIILQYEKTLGNGSKVTAGSRITVNENDGLLFNNSPVLTANNYTSYALPKITPQYYTDDTTSYDFLHTGNYTTYTVPKTTGGWFGDNIGVNKTGDARLVVKSTYTDGETRELRVGTDTAKRMGLYDATHSKWMIQADASGNVATASGSDRRIKNDYGILPEEETSFLLHAAIPHKFTYKEDEENKMTYGVMAQDLVKALQDNDLGYRSFLLIQDNENEGNLLTDIYADEESVTYALDYSKLVPLLHSGWLMHEKEINELKTELKEKDGKIKELENKLDMIMKHLNIGG